MPYTPHVLVIGGGVLGTAIARDLAIRGFETTLVEQGTLTAGASGRTQGVLYSGARFAATDPSGAKRCRDESDVLRRIADEYIRETGGVIAAQPGEEARLDDVLAAAEECNIRAEELSGDKLHEETDALSDDVSRGVRVRDAAIDAFRLTVATARGAEGYGADVRTGAAVTELRFEGGRIAGATVAYDDSPDAARPQPGDRSGIEPPGLDEESEDEQSGADGADDEDESEDEEDQTAPEPVADIQRSFPGATADDSPESGTTEEVEADFVVNATGAWVDRVAAMAGIDLDLDRVRGTMAVLDGELSETVLSQWGDAESRRWLSPFWGNTVLGATEEPFADAGTTAASVRELLDGATETLALDEPAILRSYTGLWTTHPGSDSAPQGPGATIIDHKRHHDRWGMLTVFGGTVTTHRAVAKSVVDRICREFGVNRPCRTDQIPLPTVDPDEGDGNMALDTVSGAKQAMTSVTNRGKGTNPVLCEERGVRRGAVQRALDEDTSLGTDLTDVRTRTGATMGDCQGGRCGHRLAAQLHPDSDTETVEQALSAFMRRRWAGRRQALWDEQLSAAMADYELHTRILGRDTTGPESFDDFDAGSEGDEPRRRPTCCEAVVP
jgi:glycerol-3-phosphate dehydrogenase